MCEKCIEIVVIKVVGVKFVEWDVDMCMLFVFLGKKGVKEEVLYVVVVVVGYDIKKVKVSEEVYVKLYVCCKYCDFE